MDSFWDTMMMTILSYLLCVQRFVVHLFLMLRFLRQKEVVPQTEDPLLLMSATKLAEQIREGKVLSENVILAYIKRIREVQPYINAVVEDRFGEALEEARVVDSLIALNYKTKEQIAKEKPLLGVPFTVKLMIGVKGMIANGASRSFEYRKARSDHEAVAALKSAGAIVIATTNMCALASHIYSSNSLYGRTKNPYDTTKSPGGSSGGEAALVAAAGSILGLGNDLGGSIRIPASLCGVFGHKPTTGIASKVEGIFPKPPPLFREFASAGPICRYAEDLLTVMKVLAGTKRAEMKLDEPVDINNLKVYYMQGKYEDDLVPPVDSQILLCQLKAMSYFETDLNAQVENLEFEEMRNIFLRCLGKYRLACNEKSIQNVVTRSKIGINVPLEFLKFLFGQSKQELNNLTYLALDSTMFSRSLRETPSIEKCFMSLQQQFSSLFDDRSILLIPAFPYRSLYHGEEQFLTHCAGYCAVFNVLGMPATYCPLTVGEDGIPMGIQVVASKGNDRLAIACAIELERRFGGWKQPPKPE